MNGAGMVCRLDQVLHHPTCCLAPALCARIRAWGPMPPLPAPWACTASAWSHILRSGPVLPHVHDLACRNIVCGAFQGLTGSPMAQMTWHWGGWIWPAGWELSTPALVDLLQNMDSECRWAILKWKIKRIENKVPHDRSHVKSGFKPQVLKRERI